jgi:hypothetical protein
VTPGDPEHAESQVRLRVPSAECVECAVSGRVVVRKDVING